MLASFRRSDLPAKVGGGRSPLDQAGAQTQAHELHFNEVKRQREHEQASGHLTSF